MAFEFGKLFLILGALFLVIGAVLLLGPKIPLLGRLPGDIHLETRSGMSIYFPVVTCIVVSVALTALLNLFSGWK